MSRLFVLLPVTDDASGVEATVARLEESARQHRWDVHVVALDDSGGHPAERMVAQRGGALAVEVVAHRFARGTRETLRDGLEWIGDRCNDDDVALVLRAPDPTDVAAVPLLLAAIEAGADVVVAAAEPADSPVWQRAGVSAGRYAVRALFHIAGVRDPLAPTLALRGATLRAALQRHQGNLLGAATADFLFPVELLDKLARNGARCSQVDLPVRRAHPLPGRLPWADAVRTTVALHSRLRRAEAVPLQPELPVPLARWEWAALAAVLVIALTVRLYAIQRIPAVVFHDECDNLVNVYQIFNGRGPGFFGFDWKPQPAASVYVLSMFMRMGMSILTLRLPAVLYSVAALIPFYILLRRAVSVPAALGATALLATDVWYLHFSRTGWENVATCIFLAAGALTLRDGLRSGRMRSFVWAGVWSALGAYSYFAGRAVYPAVALACFAAYWRPRIPRSTIVGGFLLTTVVTFTLFGPQLPNIIRHWDLFQKRSRTVSLLSESRGVRHGTRLLASSFVSKSTELFFGRPTFDRYLLTQAGPIFRVTTVLLAAGMILSLWWRAEAGLWWIFLLVPFVLTQVLTTGELNGARGVIFVPILYLFVGLSLHVIWRALSVIARPVGGLVLVGALAISITTTRMYFNWVQSPALVQGLYPSFPVAEFPAWQAHVLDWTKRSDDFFNVYMWEDVRRRAQAAAAASPPAP
jgi:hypothetical protein